MSRILSNAGFMLRTRGWQAALVYIVRVSAGWRRSS